MRLLVSLVGVLRQLNDSRTQLEELWAARKLKLDLCLQLRLFERDAVEVTIMSIAVIILSLFGCWKWCKSLKSILLLQKVRTIAFDKWNGYPSRIRMRIVFWWHINRHSFTRWVLPLMATLSLILFLYARFKKRVKLCYAPRHPSIHSSVCWSVQPSVCKIFLSG